MKKIFISGYYGFANAGDEAILTVILRDLRERIDGARFTVVSGNPEATRRAHGVEAAAWSDALAIAEGVRDADLVIVGGGGLFHDYTGFIPDALFTEGNWGLGFHATPAILASLDQVPLMLYAVGVGPLFSEHGKRYTRAACAAAARVTVRDAASKTLLVEIGVPEGKVEVTADPALALEPAGTERAREILAQAGLSAFPRPLIAVVVRHWAFGVHPVFWEGEVAAGLDRFLEATAGQVLFVPFQQFPGEQENDGAVSARVRSRMRRQEQALVLEGAYTPAETAAVLGACDLVVGMRLHALLFSQIACVPFVALRYDPKVSHAVQRAGREKFTIDIGAVEAPALAALMRDALNAPAAQAEPLAGAARRNAEIALEVMAVTPGPPPPEVLNLVAVGVHAQLRESRELRDRAAWRERQARDLEEQIARVRAEAEAAREADAQCHTALRAQIEQLQKRFDEAAARNGALLSGLEEFQQEYGRKLALYRSQRAWKVMLAARRAYTLLLRRGWRGRLLFLPWLARALAGRPSHIEHEELEFPTLSPYLPEDVRSRFRR